MAAASQANPRSSAKTIAVVILAIIGVVAIVAGIMYFTEPAKSLPSVLGTITSPAARANGHRDTRGAVAVVVGVILLVAAVLTGRSGKSARS